MIHFAPKAQPTGMAGIAASQPAEGRRLSATWYTLDPGVRVPAHAHANEELGYILRGSLELTVVDERAVLGAGEVFLVPGGALHSAHALDEGCELMECYAPPRVGPAASALEVSADADA